MTITSDTYLIGTVSVLLGFFFKLWLGNISKQIEKMGQELANKIDEKDCIKEMGTMDENRREGRSKMEGLFDVHKRAIIKHTHTADGSYKCDEVL